MLMPEQLAHKLEHSPVSGAYLPGEARKLDSSATVPSVKWVLLIQIFMAV